MDILLSLKSKQLRYTGVAIDCPTPVDIPVGITACIGENGAGKTALANIIECGWNFMTNHLTTPKGSRPRVHTLAFSNLHSLTGYKVEYYQQRFESMMNDDVPTVAELLGTTVHSEKWCGLAQRLGLMACLDKKTNYLSSGELRKLLIANAMTDLPDILVLDNPYIGLDAEARVIINDTIDEIAAGGTSVIMLICDITDLHPHTSAILPMKSLTVLDPIYLDGVVDITDLTGRLQSLFAYKCPDRTLERWAKGCHTKSQARVVDLRNCCVSYGRRVLIDDISWQIEPGECWALSGPNGSGKSTLLSLINADNPQAYSNEIWLWGKRRGSGESIWDIKRRIGFLSAESHLYFRGYNDTARRILGRAVKHDPTDFGPLTPDEAEAVDMMLELFRFESLAEHRFRELSLGHQRLVLLMAALVKKPELLILDEPLHGLDRAIKQGILQIVDRLALCGMTLIYVTHNPEEIPSCITHHKTLTKPAQ